MTLSKFLVWLTSGGGGATIAYYAYKFYIATRPERKVMKALEGKNDVAQCLSRIVSETCADYAHVAKVHNSGGELRADSPIYMTMIAEDALPHLERQYSFMQGVEADASYRKLVQNLIEKRTIVAHVDEMEDPTALGLYQIFNARVASATLLRIDRKGLLILRVFTRKDEGFNPEELLIINMAAARLKKCYT